MAYSPLVFAFKEIDKQMVRDEAQRRQAINERFGLRGRNGGPEEGAKALRAHMLGAAGELAVADYLHLRQFLYQEKEARRGSCDLPPNIDIKTRSAHWHDLICQLDERPDKILVLVTMQNRLTLIHGWIESKQAMQEQWRKDPAVGRPAYFVPKEVLQPLLFLKDAQM